MTSFVVIVPSRQRPRAARVLAAAFDHTCIADTRLVFAVDDNDPTRDDYRATLADCPYLNCEIYSTDSRTMVQALNAAAVYYAEQAFAIGFMGDDHLPRTPGWDAVYLSALRELGTGIVYGDDLLQHERIPTQVAMTADIVRALGFMAPPVLSHLYVDNYWRDLGEATRSLQYLPGVVIEHMHPVAGKANWDDGYNRVNAPAMYRADFLAYSQYPLLDDAAKVRALL